MVESIAPWFGYAASLFLIIALLVKKETLFRLFNLSGNVSFLIYGGVFHVWPVIITNTILLVINIYCLRQFYFRKEAFDLVEISEKDALAAKFLEFYRADILDYFPDFDSLRKNDLHFVVLRDLVIANIFSAEVLPGGLALVRLNYTVKRFGISGSANLFSVKKRAFLWPKVSAGLNTAPVPMPVTLNFCKQCILQKQRQVGKKNFKNM